MAEILDLLRARRSVRQYTGEKISDEILKQIASAALLAPSGHSKYPCEFILVKNSETLEKMSHCRAGAAKMLTGAAAAIVVIADREKSDTIIEDGSVAMMNMEIAATALGIGNCWIQIRGREAENGVASEDFLREILEFPANFACQAILSLGMAAKSPKPRELEKLHFDKIHADKF